MASSPIPPSSANPGVADWALLPPQLLVSIAEQLPISACYRLRAVCASWASALSDLLPPSPTFPWLLLPQSRAPLSFLPLSPHRRPPFPFSLLPRLPISESESESIVGSSNGWLVTLGRSFASRLLNPLTGSHIRLPSLVHPLNIRKVVLSSSGAGGLVAVAMYGPLYYCLALSRPGDAAWTPLNAEGVEDIVVHDGKLFAVFTRGKVQVFDLVTLSSSLLYGSSYDGSIASFCRSSSFQGYLVSSAGDLLQVWRERDVGSNATIRFVVTKLENSCWVGIEGLGDRSLFLGSSHSLSISTRGVPWLRGNCIYFIVERRDSQKRSVCDVGVFDIEKGTVEPCFPPNLELSCARSMPPLWYSSFS